MKKKSVKSVKRKNKFYCELCNYTASQKSHFNKHLSTKKHKRMTGKNVENPVKKVLKSVIHMYTCDVCNKQYKDRSGLRYHKKNASCYKIQTPPQIPTPSTNKINNINGNKLDDLTKQMTKLTSSITEAVDSGMLGTKNVITNNNISINFFLDKYCNNAQSLQDFVENISFQLNDIVNDNQMIENFISKKVLKNLEDIPITERPIHCTDQKRRNFMVKDKNEGWVKDSVDTNGSLYTQVHQLHSKAYIDFYTEYDKVHPLPHDTNHETFKCEMASKLLNYDKRNLVNDIAKTADIRDVVAPAGINIEDGCVVDSLNRPNAVKSIDIIPSYSMKDMEKENNNIELGNIKLTNVSPTDNAAVINHNTTTTTVDSNVIDIKHNMMNMVNIMNSMVGKLDTDGN
jgi:hypothetical protein